MAPTYVLGPFRLDAKAEILFRGAEPVAAAGKGALALSWCSIGLRSSDPGNVG
jgi:hypothetical protein